MKKYSNLVLKGIVAGLMILLVQSCGLVGSEAETTLIVTVRDHNSQQFIQGGSVTLYKNVSDWTYSQNAYRTTNTDINGQATFTGIDSGIDYYFDAEQAGKNNYSYTNHVGSTVKTRKTTYVSTEID